MTALLMLAIIGWVLLVLGTIAHLSTYGPASIHKLGITRPLLLAGVFVPFPVGIYVLWRVHKRELRQVNKLRHDELDKEMKQLEAEL